MKNIAQFNAFLSDTVNLNKQRYEIAVASVGAVTLFLKTHERSKELFIDTKPQGSFRQKTIIRPATDKDEFDVDLLFEMRIVRQWQPKDYLSHVANQFQDSPRYKDKVDTRGKSRCVTIDYECDFHIDVVPAIENAGQQYIMNRKDNGFEVTDGDGYARWFAGQNVTAGGTLVAVVRLVKFLRDIRNSFDVKSVVLTTLLGNMVKTDDDKLMTDTPTALYLLIDRLDKFLQPRPQVPLVTNPALAAENFNRHWEQAKYARFRNGVNDLAARITDAYNEHGDVGSLEKWQDIFGSDFPSGAIEEGAGADARAINSGSLLPLADTSHCQPPPWSDALQYRVHVDGYLYSRSGTCRYRGINSEARFMSGLAIKFICITNTPAPYDVYWQVVNTGRHAQSKGSLRGDFFKAKDLHGRLMSNQHINWEISEFTGKHWIESFIVKPGIGLVARSGRFFVNITNPSFS